MVIMKLITAVVSSVISLIILHVGSDVEAAAAAAAVAVASPLASASPDPTVVVRQAREDEHRPITMHLSRLQLTGSGGDADEGIVSFDIPLEQIIEDVRIAVPASADEVSTAEGEEEEEEEGNTLRETTLMIGVADRPEEIAARTSSGVWLGYFSGGPEQADEIRCRLTLVGERRAMDDLNFATALKEWAQPGQMWPVLGNWTEVTCIAFIFH